MDTIVNQWTKKGVLSNERENFCSRTNNGTEVINIKEI